MRRTFVCLGDAVNLVGAADVGGARPARSTSTTGPPGGRRRVHLGAAAGPVGQGQDGRRSSPTPLTGSLERASRRKVRFELELVGRRRSSRTLDDHLEAATAGDGRIVGIAAEAGMGKSRLVAEFVRGARRRGLFVAFGECQSFGTNTSYFVWREIWRRLFGLEDGDPERADAPRSRRRWRPSTRRSSRAPRCSATLLGIDIPDTELTRRSTPSSARRRSRTSLATCLRGPGRARAGRPRPRGLPLDRRAVARPARGPGPRRPPTCRCSSCSPTDRRRSPAAGSGIERLPDFSELALDELEGDEDAAAHPIQARAGARRPAATGRRRAGRAS